MPTVMGGIPQCTNKSESQPGGNLPRPSPPHTKSSSRGQGAQCAEVDHSVKRMKTHVELNSTAPDKGNIKEEGEDGGSNHVLHDERVESLEGTCTMLDQS